MKVCDLSVFPLFHHEIQCANEFRCVMDIWLTIYLIPAEISEQESIVNDCPFFNIIQYVIHLTQFCTVY